METLTAFVIVVSVTAQLITLFVLHRTLRTQSARADLDHARPLEIDRADRLRRCYGNLIKAAEYLACAYLDLLVFPTGHARQKLAAVLKVNEATLFGKDGR
jgi:hypothetical protein